MRQLPEHPACIPAADTPHQSPVPPLPPNTAAHTAQSGIIPGMEWASQTYISTEKGKDMREDHPSLQSVKGEQCQRASGKIRTDTGDTVKAACTSVAQSSSEAAVPVISREYCEAAVAMHGEHQLHVETVHQAAPILSTVNAMRQAKT
ncbi:hypothetical protein MG293_017602 [Ovis ammon polii]|uniref:Uncharacterized protein n=1 Tax=Ovis ammon polii TaxID=230172 RepID=A0AAD4TQC8_OVIAM|nr:hypothetical protein MG293_017602 [Ovis ammon polii]